MDLNKVGKVRGCGCDKKQRETPNGFKPKHGVDALHESNDAPAAHAPRLTSTHARCLLCSQAHARDALTRAALTMAPASF